MGREAGGQAEGRAEGRALPLPGEVQRLRLPSVRAQQRGAQAGGRASGQAARLGATRLGSAPHRVERPRPAAPRYGEGGQEGMQLPGLPEEELAPAQHRGCRADG